MKFFVRYLGALIYDALILFALSFALTGLILLFNNGTAIPPGTYWYQLAIGGLTLIYYYNSIKFGGQTLGMKAWRFKLTTATQGNLTRKHIVTRFFFFVPTLLIAPCYLSANYTLLNRWTKTHFVTI